MSQQATFFRNKIFDTTPGWFYFSVIYGAAHFFVHAAFNGWLPFFYYGHNFYNDAATHWIGTFPWDPMHLSAGFVIGSLLFNLAWGVQKKHYMIIPVALTLLAISWITLGWEMLEYVVYNANKTGFIQVDLLDTLWDELTNFIGATIAVLVGERLT